MESLASAGVVATVFMLVLIVLWICLPFALFGIKPRLDKIAAEERANGDLLRQVIEELQVARGHQKQVAPPSPEPVLEPQPPPSVPKAKPAPALDERAEKLARARALAAKIKPSAPGENRLE